MFFTMTSNELPRSSRIKKVTETFLKENNLIDPKCG